MILKSIKKILIGINLVCVIDLNRYKKNLIYINLVNTIILISANDFDKHKKDLDRHWFS